jgi:hypothetical protein
MRGLRLLVAGALLVGLPGVSHAEIGSELNGLGSFGASLGVFRWLDNANGQGAATFQGHAATIRPTGKAVFRYRINTNWLVSVETGFGWNGYPESNDVTTWVLPITVGLERRLGDLWGMTTSLAFGAGPYVWGRWEKGDTMLDPVTSKPLHAVDPGAYGGLAGEFHVSEHVTCAAHLTLNTILSTHGDDFQGTLGDTKLYSDLRFGVNYYFSPYEGLIW